MELEENTLFPPEDFDWKSFDVSFESYFQGDEVYTEDEYEKLYLYVAEKCAESGEYIVDCWKNRYTVRKKADIESIHYNDFSDEEKKEFDKNKELGRLNVELASAQTELEKMDYIGVKIATGRATVQDYAVQVARMSELAARVDALREQIAALEA